MKKNKKKGQFAEVWSRFCKNHLAFLGLVIITIIFVMAVMAPVLAPEGYDNQNISIALSQPGTQGHIWEQTIWEETF